MKACCLLVCVIAAVSCRQDMNDQAKYKPLKSSDFFADGAASRPLPEHTVARGELKEDKGYYTGRTGVNEFVSVLPVAMTPELLKRGAERYDIYCAVCHGRSGEGDGMVVQRGFPRPPAYSQERLRNAPAGYLFDVMTNGYGVMYSYASRVEPADRWAIAAYIRVLQLSQHAALPDAEVQERQRLEAAP